MAYEEFEARMMRLVEAVTGASRLTYASIAVGLVFLFLFFKIMFRAPGSFERDAHNSLRRRPILYDPEYVDRGWSKLKIFLWLALSTIGGWAAHHKLPELFPNFFR